MANLGQKLAEARNRKGISIREASDTTKIRGDYLAKFENDDFEVNLPPVYLRGFLKNYAKYLDLDPEGILADFDNQWTGQGKDRGTRPATYGTISIGDPHTPESSTETSQTENATTQTKKPPSFPWYTISITLGSLVAVTLLVIFIIDAMTGEGEVEDTNTEEASEVKEQGIVTPPAIPEEGQQLKLIASGPIKLIHLKPESSDQAAQTFRALQEGDERELPASLGAFMGYVSEIENLVLVSADGSQRSLPGTGAGKFRWPPKPSNEE